MSDAEGARRGYERIVPYAVVFCGAAFLLYRANHFDFTAAADQTGPDSWPKIILYCIMAVCAFEGIRRFGFDKPTVESKAVPVEPSPFEREHADPRIVFSCVAAAVVYLLFFEILGFFVDTILFVFALLWIGRFRRLSIAAVISVSITFFFMIVFLRIIFVALPIGDGPFASISTAVMRFIGVR